MKYAKEKMFLELLPDYLVKDLISFNIWDDLEKKIIEGIYIKKKTKEEIQMIIIRPIIEQ